MPAVECRPLPRLRAVRHLPAIAAIACCPSSARCHWRRMPSAPCPPSPPSRARRRPFPVPSSDAIACPIFGGPIVETSRGPVSVFVCGDQGKPAMVTYPDVALNWLFFYPDTDFLLLQNFCIYHFNAPGHEFLQLGAVVIPPDVPSLSVDDLADQVAEVLDFFGIRKVICLGSLVSLILWCEKLVFVPPSLVIASDLEWSNAEAGDVLKKYFVPDWPYLATYLINEASLMYSSRWSRYISALPRQPYSLLY